MKKLLIVLAVIVVLLLSGAYFLLRAPSVTAALLYIESGEVQVDVGKGWITGTDEMELSRGAKVKTIAGEATVVLLEGEFIHLEPNSEISIDEVTKNQIKLSQKVGQTWNKITKLSGIKGYIVSTPNTVATVRGTEFILSDEEILVDDGEVEYEHIAKKEKIKVRAKKKALAAAMKEEDTSESAKFEQQKGKYLKVLKKVRQREVRKHKFLTERAGYKEQQINQKLEEIDAAPENSEDEAYAKVPRLMKKKAERTYHLTKEIKRVKR